MPRRHVADRHLARRHPAAGQRLQADGDLEGHRLLMPHIVAQELEALGFHGGVDAQRPPAHRHLQQVPHAVGMGRHRLRPGETVPQPQLAFLRRQGVILREHREDRLAHGEQHLEIRQIDRLEHQREVGAELRQVMLRRHPVAHPDRERHAGMRPAIGRDLFGQEIGQQRLRTGDGYMPPPRPRQVRHLALHPCEVRDLRPDMLDQQLSRRIQAHAAGQALEDRIAELLLEAGDAPVQGRGGDRHVLRRLADGAGTGHRLDQAQGLQMSHGASLTWGRLPKCCK